MTVLENFWIFFFSAGVFFIVTSAECDTTYNGVRYNTEIILNEPGKFVYTPKNLALDINSNILYFTYYNTINKTHESMKLNLNTKEYVIIKELNGECSFTIDERRNSVYAGCKDGLYHYDTNIEEFVLIYREDDVKSVYFHKVLYYFKGDSEILFQWSNYESQQVLDVTEGVSQMIIDTDNDKTYITNQGVCYLSNGSPDLVYYKGSRGVRSLAMNSIGNIYACDYDKDEISLLDKGNRTVVKVVDARWCHGLVIDKDGNFVFADWKTDTINRIVRC